MVLVAQPVEDQVHLHHHRPPVFGFNFYTPQDYYAATHFNLSGECSPCRSRVCSTHRHTMQSNAVRPKLGRSDCYHLLPAALTVPGNPPPAIHFFLRIRQS